MFAVIYIPDFSLQAALRHEPELATRPVALVDESLPKPAIIQLTQAARATGVCAGLTSTQAMARCREIIIKPHSAIQETAATDTILQCGYLFSPYVETTAPGICTLDLRGQSSAGDEQFGQQIITLLQQFHLKAQIGVAATPSVALHAARRASPFLRVDNPAGFLNELPIESLAPSPELLNILHRWGIHDIGAFLALGKDALAERLGSESLQLFERASTTQARPLKLTNPPQIFEETYEFENEIESLEPLLFILHRFLEQLALRLTVSSFAAEQIFLRLTLSENSKYERAFKIPAPTTDENVLFRVLFTHLEDLRTEHPIKALYLRAQPCRPASEQFGLFDCILRDPNHFYETVGRLIALLGPDCVGIPAVQWTWRPDAFQMQPVDSHFDTPPGFGVRQSSGALSRIKPCRKRQRTGALQDASALFDCPFLGLTLRRFRPPLPAHVEINNQQPSALRSPLFHGRIQRATGPWRSSGQWWDKQRWQRDEWDVQTANGQLFRLFNEHDGWFIEGVYD